ncbi:hypothetical protein TNCV_220891 [Trichonephila clavipes]|nr:hypothetical protein TNCV_220891 [Trichonephila clavipes]
MMPSSFYQQAWGLSRAGRMNLRGETPLDCFDQQCLEYQKDEQWKKQNIPRYLTGVYLKFWYENHLFEKSYQTSKELLMTVFDATKQEDIRKFHKLKLNDTKELISFLRKTFVGEETKL